MRCFAIIVVGGLLATCLIANLDVAQAGAMVTADVLTRFAALGAKGTTELRGYSQDFGQTNQTFFGDLTRGRDGRQLGAERRGPAEYPKDKRHAKNRRQSFADTLWHLNLAADWPLGGTSDVSVDLELNSLAPQKIVLPSSYLLSLSGYSTSLSDQEVAMLISAVDNAIIGALGFAGGRALL